MTPSLLRLFIQTITLILSTLGAIAPNLIALTHDSIALLISLHSTPVATEPTVLSALLSLLLAVVDLNISSSSTAEERLVTDLGTEMMELREWVGGIFDRVPKGDNELRTLAAGIMVKIGEVVDRYQGRLLGINVAFGF
jgi:telomere length regulation protein